MVAKASGLAGARVSWLSLPAGIPARRSGQAARQRRASNRLHQKDKFALASGPGRLLGIRGCPEDGLARILSPARTIHDVSIFQNHPETSAREVRALSAAADLHPEATPLLLTLETWPPSHAMPKPLLWRSAIEWLLESPSG